MHYTPRLASIERRATYWTSAAINEEDGAALAEINGRLAEYSAEVAALRLRILHETARRIRPHSLVNTSGAMAHGLPYTHLLHCIQ